MVLAGSWDDFPTLQEIRANQVRVLAKLENDGFSFVFFGVEAQCQ